MKKVWYRKQPSRFRDINASPNRPAFFSDDFDYMTLFGDDMQQPKVFVVFLDENTPVFDVWNDSVEELCGYPVLCIEFLRADALETMTYCLDKFLEMIGDRPTAKMIRLALKKLDERNVPAAFAYSDAAEAADVELLEFAEWAAKIVKRANTKGVPPYKVVMGDMIQAKPGIKGIIDGPESLMSIDPNIQSSVAYTLSMREVNWLSDHRITDMQSNDPVRVRAAVDAYRCRYGVPAKLKEDKEPLLVTDLGSVLHLKCCGKQKDLCWAHMLDECGGV